MSNKDEKQIKIVSGDANDLDISLVYEHIKRDSNIDEENTNKKKNKKIVIPKSDSDSKNQ